jgi:CheY-like chemotaxis protein
VIPILIVDDDSFNLYALKQLLEAYSDRSLDIHFAKNGIEAIDMVQYRH